MRVEYNHAVRPYTGRLVDLVMYQNLWDRLGKRAFLEILNPDGEWICRWEIKPSKWPTTAHLARECHEQALKICRRDGLRIRSASIVKDKMTIPFNWNTFDELL